MLKSCSLAIFAHNLENNIVDCINSILASDGEWALTIHVLANGCTDNTGNVVEKAFAKRTGVKLVTISVADKANAWNHYIHRIANTDTHHIFVDGDVTLSPGALSALLDTLASNSDANAVGAVPSVGRDRVGWISRMFQYGRVSGGLYALSRSFVEYIIENQIKLPQGFIGEDFLVSAWAKDLWGMEGIYQANPKLVICPSATFSFRQLSFSRIQDVKTYIRRLIRYRLRDYQLSMLMQYFEIHGIEYIPQTEAEIYQLAGHTPGYHWRGKGTLIDWLAVRHIRNAKYIKAN